MCAEVAPLEVTTGETELFVEAHGVGLKSLGLSRGTCISLPKYPVSWVQLTSVTVGVDDPRMLLVLLSKNFERSAFPDGRLEERSVSYQWMSAQVVWCVGQSVFDLGRKRSVFEKR